MADGKVRRVNLGAKQVEALYLAVMGAVATSRAVERRIDAAEMKLGKLLDASLSIEGQVDYDLAKLPERIDCEFTELEMFGIKTGLVQTVLGAQSRQRAHHGRIKYFLMPIAKLLGIEAIVKKESALPEAEEEKLAIQYDGEPAESKRVDLDEKPAPPVLQKV